MTCVRKREVWRVKGQLFLRDFDEFSSSVGHPPTETFPVFSGYDLVLTHSIDDGVAQLANGRPIETISQKNIERT